jgi:hypothetical protein
VTKNINHGERSFPAKHLEVRDRDVNVPGVALIRFGGQVS